MQSLVIKSDRSLAIRSETLAKMKLIFVVLSLFAGVVTSLDQTVLGAPKVEDLVHQVGQLTEALGIEAKPQPNGVIGDLIKNVLGMIEGSKNEFMPGIDIDPYNSVRNITFSSDVAPIILDMKETLRMLDIRNLTIPVSRLDLEGLYDFEEIPIMGLSIYGKGKFWFRIEELLLFVSVKLKYSSTTLWTVEDIVVDTSMKKSFIRIGNLMNGEPLGEFLNSMVDELFKVGVDLVHGLVEQYKTEIKEVIAMLINKFMGS